MPESTSTQPPIQGAADPIAEAVAIMARLRAPGGCPWDREQTFDSIKRHTLEETYEVFDAIERRDWPGLKDELGDLLLQVLFYAQMASEAGHFDIMDVARNLNAKLIRRHPHIFGNVEATDANAVLRNWELIKREEKKSAAKPSPESLLDESLLDDVPRSMPAILEASKLGSKAAKVGFDWPNADGLFEKLDEEIAELKSELNSEPNPGVQAGKPTPAAAELGDILFTAVNLARHLKIDPETALRDTNARFRRRFRAMESAAGGHESLEHRTPSELEALWADAKSAESASAPYPRSGPPSHPKSDPKIDPPSHPKIEAS